MRISVAGVTDISDRATREIGQIRWPDVAQQFSDSIGDAERTGVLTSTGNIRILNVAPYAFGTTWNRIRNIQAGGVKHALGEADPRFIGLYAGNLFTVNDFSRAPAAATQRVVYRITNPLGSGERVWITYISVLCNVARRWGYTIFASAQPARGTALTEVSKQSNGPAATVVASLDANVAADLTTFYHSSLLQAAVPRDYFEPIQLQADSSIDIQVGDVADATTDRMTINVEWVEETT